LGEEQQMDIITYHPIGIIHSPFRETVGMPIQAAAAVGIAGTIQLEPEYAEGLKDIDGFSHLILIYHLHLVREFKMIVRPYLDDQPRGIFATRAPRRPNPIGMSIVRLNTVTGSTLGIQDVDVVDGTPLLDIKPWVPDFDVRMDARIGWLAKNIAHMRDVRSTG
jgi:tRNA-Thr(GGU) m(6)t(6)A37 methyltransferase TsaA